MELMTVPLVIVLASGLTAGIGVITIVVGMAVEGRCFRRPDRFDAALRRGLVREQALWGAYQRGLRGL